MDRRRFLAAIPALPSTAAAQPPAAPLADPPRALTPTGADLGTLAAEIERVAAATRYSLRFPHPRFPTFTEYRAAARAAVLDALAYFPEKVEPRAEVTDRVDRGDHVRERVLFSTSPASRVPAYVLVPKGLKGPAPAVIDLHSHGGMFLFGKEKVIDLGANHPAMTEYHRVNYDGRPTATELVRRGYVVATIDALMFGERRVVVEADAAAGWDRSRYTLDEVRRLNAVCRGKESTVVKGLTLAGATWPGVVAWDDMRTVDYVATRPDVDPKRIGCLGISMGGYRAAYLTALDDRITAGCVVGFMSAVAPMRKAHLDTHSFVHFLPGLHRLMDFPDLAALAAPRALLVQQCRQDRLFPPEGMTAAVDRIAEVYAAARCPRQFEGRFYDEPHRFTRAMQDDAFAWLDRHLKA